MEEDIVNIDAKLTQMEGTVRQMSDDQFTVNNALGQLADPALGDASGSINAHVRYSAQQLLQVNGTLNLLDTDLTGIDNTLGTLGTQATASAAATVLGTTADAAVGDANGTINAHIRYLDQKILLLATEATLASLVAATGGATGFFQQVSGIIATGAQAVVDISSSAVCKYALRVEAVGGATAWDVRLELDLVNSFIGDNTNHSTHVTGTGSGVVVWSALEHAARFMRARVVTATFGAGSLTVQIYAVP